MNHYILCNRQIIYLLFDHMSYHVMVHLVLIYPAKIIIFFRWQLHAFVEYDTIEDAARAVCVFI
jgi:hypothetical protein